MDQLAVAAQDDLVCQFTRNVSRYSNDPCPSVTGDQSQTIPAAPENTFPAFSHNGSGASARLAAAVKQCEGLPLCEDLTPENEG